jgi:hypothetical protein
MFGILLMIFSNLGCTDRSNHKIQLPDNLPTYVEHTRDVEWGEDKDFKIYYRLNGSCPTCITHVGKIQKMSDELGNVSLHLICHSIDNFEFLKLIAERGEFDSFNYPFYLDVENSFSKSNTFLADLKFVPLILTNANNEVIYIADFHDLDNEMLRISDVIKNH